MDTTIDHHGNLERRAEIAWALLQAEAEVRAAQKGHDGSEEARARYRSALRNLEAAQSIAELVLRLEGSR